MASIVPSSSTDREGGGGGGGGGGEFQAFQSGTITVRNLRLSTVDLVPDAWGRTGKTQPTLVSVRLARADHLGPAAAADNVARTVSYSDVAKLARRAHEENKAGDSGADDANHVFNAHAAFYQSMVVLLKDSAGSSSSSGRLEVTTVFPKGLKRGDDGGWGVRTVYDDGGSGNDDNDNSGGSVCWCFVDKLRLACIIGVNPHERLEKQDVVIGFEALLSKEKKPGAWLSKHFLGLVNKMIQTAEISTFQTVEALAYELSKIFGQDGLWPQTKISVEKPNAIAIVDGCGVDMTFKWTSDSAHK